MTKPGGRITVARSVVTGISIGNTDGGLYVEGVDQDRDGATLKYHTLLVTQETLREEQPDVGDAVEAIRAYAQRRIDDA